MKAKKILPLSIAIILIFNMLGVIALPSENIKLETTSAASTKQIKSNVNSFTIEEENSFYDESSISGKGPFRMLVCHIKEDGSVERILKKMTFSQRRELMKKLNQPPNKSNIKEQLEEKLEIFKEYELVSPETTLGDIINTEILDGEYQYPIQLNGSFTAQPAILFFLAFPGFGFGFGLPLLPFTGMVHLAVISFFGAVWCIDLTTRQVHNAIAFIFPFIIGQISGFTGLLMIPFVPGFIYSNLIGFGHATYTRWFTIPPI
ncbi:MAG: hypothetical protein JSW06_11025 [Thermoplasmatales archaeon]|nr:MAG: hypothetical protein JSW06_11025 [Thermoplasmatales archaeon]